MRPHRLRARLESDKPAPAMVALGRKGIAQQPVDALPGGEHLRTRDLLGQPAGAIENLARGDGDAERVRLQPELAQALDQLGLRDDTGAAAGQFAPTRS